MWVYIEFIGFYSRFSFWNIELFKKKYFEIFWSFKNFQQFIAKYCGFLGISFGGQKAEKKQTIPKQLFPAIKVNYRIRNYVVHFFLNCCVMLLQSLKILHERIQSA